MQIREYQNWLQKWDKARNWDKTLPSHTLLHALEELSEISRLVQVIEGYRAADVPTDTLRDALALELSDLQVMIFKLAYQCDIDMQEAMTRGQAKADARFPDPASGPPEQAAYWRRFQSYLEAQGLSEPGASSPAPADPPPTDGTTD
jgi:NTP pyrophosphatase (non-canonical NTP hydrolase)